MFSGVKVEVSARLNQPTPEQGPKPSRPGVVKGFVCQAADDAKFDLSAQPFQLFSVGLFIFGSLFCVAAFDRAGILFSPIQDMWKDTKIFIRVIRSLTCRLAPGELGQDPTVSISPDQQREIWRKQTRESVRELPKDFPTFVVSVGDRRWFTVGLPIWTSVSLLGRGTCVWLVQEDSKGPLLVLKNTWRNVSRISESMIYGSVEGHHPALAKLHWGEDVRFPEEQRYIMTRNLRDLSPHDDIDGGDVVLHRLLLESRGRPLWEYDSDKELLQRIRAALSGTCPSSIHRLYLVDAYIYDQRMNSCASRVFCIVISALAILCFRCRLHPKQVQRAF